MFGKLFDSLSYRVSSEERDWYRQNELRRSLRYPAIQRWLIRSARRPLVTAFELFWLSILLCLHSVCWGGILGIDAVCWMSCLSPPELERWDRGHLLAGFTSLWTIQATIVALVYPFVIAFVALLFQQRNASNARIQVYLFDSGAILAGLSALFLILAMSVQFLLIVEYPSLPTSTIAVWSLLDAIWFSFNVTLTIWFLIRTFLFLRPGGRTRIIRDFVINVSWPEEVKEKLRPLMFYGATTFNIMPGPDYSDAQAQNRPRILLHDLGRDMGGPEVSISLPESRVLQNVYFRLIRWVAHGWFKRAGQPVMEESKRASVLEGRKEDLLIFPAVPGRTYDHDVVVCRTEGAFHLSWMEKLAARAAFRFQAPAEDDERMDVAAFFSELESDALGGIAKGSRREFEEAFWALINLHGLVLRASAFTTNDGTPDNYAQVADTSGWDRPVFEGWLRSYIVLFDAAVARLMEEDEYFDRLAHIGGYLFRRSEGLKTQRVRDKFIQLPPVLMNRLGNWWHKHLDSPVAALAGICSPAALADPYRTVYEDGWRKFAGAWESIKDVSLTSSHRSKASKSVESEWGDFQEWTPSYVTHLDETLTMFLRAVLRGDQTAAEWSADILQRWVSTLELRASNRSFMLRSPRFVTLEVMSRRWPEVLTQLEIEDAYPGAQPVERDVFFVALKNYWVDCKCLAVYLLTIWGKDCPCDSSLAAKFIRGLIEGAIWRGGGERTGGSDLKISLEKALQTLIRQNFADGGYRLGYRNRLDALVERLESLREQDWVSGRIYSRVGADDLESVADGHLVWLCLSANSDRGGAAVTEAEIQKWVVQDDGRVRNLKTYLDMLKARLESEEFGKFNDLYRCIRRLKGEGSEFADARRRVAEGLSKTVEVIESVRSHEVENALIDQNRLAAAATAASRLGFSKSTGDFPLPLFDAVTSIDESLRERTLIFNNLAKGEFTEREMAQRPVNQDDFFAETIRNHVANVVMAESLQKLTTFSADGATASEYWKALSEAARTMKNSGLTPILLLENPTIPEWVWDWQHTRLSDEEYARPKDMSVTRREGMGKSYVCHFNEIAVYTAPIPAGASYVVAREVFKEVKFKAYSEGRFVSVSTSPVDGDFAKINLRFTWALNVTVGAEPVTKLVYEKHTARHPT